MPSFFDKLQKGMNTGEISPSNRRNVNKETNDAAGEIVLEKKEIDKRTPARKKGSKVRKTKQSSEIKARPEQFSVSEMGDLSESLHLPPDDYSGHSASVPIGAKEPSSGEIDKTVSQIVEEMKEEIIGNLDKEFAKKQRKQPETMKPEIKENKKWPEEEGQLTVDVYETQDEVVIRSALAGVRPDDLEISVENDVVRIKGSRQKVREEKSVNYFVQECFWGPFSREIILPVEVDASRTDANIKEGILMIKIPKIQREKKRVTIKS